MVCTLKSSNQAGKSGADASYRGWQEDSVCNHEAKVLLFVATDRLLTLTQTFPPDTHFPMGSMARKLANAGDPRADTQAVSMDTGPPTPPAAIPAATSRHLGGEACGLRPSLVGPGPPTATTASTAAPPARRAGAHLTQPRSSS